MILFLFFLNDISHHTVIMEGDNYSGEYVLLDRESKLFDIITYGLTNMLMKCSHIWQEMEKNYH